MIGERTRQYVLVDTAKTVSGIEVPNKIYWFDGRTFEVDSIEQIKPLPKAKDGATLFTVVIGGSNGIDKAVTDRANLRLCLGKHTMTHTMTRLIILEQIYRGFKINSGENYHK